MIHSQSAALVPIASLRMVPIASLRMRPQPHRWLDRLVLLPVVVLVTAIAAMLGSGAGDHERITHAWYLAELPAPDGAAPTRISELITYDFGWSSRHGIYRDVPDLLDRESVRVSSSSAPSDVAFSRTSGLTRIQIGDPDRVVSQDHSYAIDYVLPASTLVREGQFAWDAHGLSWAVGAEHVEAHVVGSNAWTDIRCFVGPEDSQDLCDIEQIEPGHLVASADGLSRQEAMTIVAVPGDALDRAPVAPEQPSPPPSEGFGILMSMLVAGAAAAAAAVPVSIWSRWRGRDQVAIGGPADAAFADGASSADGAFRLVDDADLARMATVEFEAPRSLSAVQGTILMNEAVSDGIFTTWLLEAAGRGEVDIETTARNDKAATLRWGDAPGAGDAGSVLAGIFAGRDTVGLGKYDKKMNTARQRVVREARTWLQVSDFWDRRATARNGAVVGRGVVGGLAALAAMFVAAYLIAERTRPVWLGILVLAALATGALFASVIRSWELRVRTPAGSAAWLQVESFRRFLHQSEARHVEAAAKAGQLRQYTAWAVALGETKAWTRAVDAASAADPGLGSQVGRDMVFAAHASSFASVVSTSSTPRSSGGSSGGGGFGGGAGGGGGGGGGGSW